MFGRKIDECADDGSRVHFSVRHVEGVEVVCWVVGQLRHWHGHYGRIHLLAAILAWGDVEMKAVMAGRFAANATARATMGIRQNGNSSMVIWRRCSICGDCRLYRAWIITQARQGCYGRYGA